jgi:hypothetical protein
MPIRCRTVYTYDGADLFEDHVLYGEPEFEIHATVYPGEEPSWDNPGSPGEIEISQVYHNVWSDPDKNDAAIYAFQAEYEINHKIRERVNEQIWEAAAECAQDHSDDW